LLWTERRYSLPALGLIGSYSALRGLLVRCLSVIRGGARHTLAQSKPIPLQLYVVRSWAFPRIPGAMQNAAIHLSSQPLLTAADVFLHRPADTLLGLPCSGCMKPTAHVGHLLGFARDRGHLTFSFLYRTHRPRSRQNRAAQQKRLWFFVPTLSAPGTRVFPLRNLGLLGPSLLLSNNLVGRACVGRCF